MTIYFDEPPGKREDRGVKFNDSFSGHLFNLSIFALFALFALFACQTFLVIQQDCTVPRGTSVATLDKYGFIEVSSSGWSPLAYRSFRDRESSGFIAKEIDSGKIWKVAVILDCDSRPILRKIWEIE